VLEAIRAIATVATVFVEEASVVDNLFLAYCAESRCGTFLYAGDDAHR